ncbi:hypothetical protein CRE_25727 [Caenorhabditis remanei]|uniref:Uncharacterized protein n=1 Tax=Caenorhabditis remanei TaxID=31234 RepID=E3MLB5_CAERE|nr:hypothetical protein CRE_25727 [Caenorhabditis remanei]
MDNYSLLSSEDHMEMRQFVAAGTDVQIFGKNRRDSQGSMSGDARVQFALSQTPPVETTSSGSPPRHHHTNNAANTSTTATHHTLSPVIQCFQKDQ